MTQVAKRIRNLCELRGYDEERAQRYERELKEKAEDAAESGDLSWQTKVFKALAHPTRIAILRLLADKPLCNCEVAAALELTQPSASHHLLQLEDAGIINTDRKGKWVYYGLSNQEILEAVDGVLQLVAT